MQPLKFILKMNSYKDLEIFQLALNLFYESHRLSLFLPKYETYELGSQLRRAADTVVTNIVEGYGRRKYKADFIRFIVFAHSSCLETYHHLEKIKTLYNDTEQKANDLQKKYDRLGKRIFAFEKYVESHWLV